TALNGCRDRARHMMRTRPGGAQCRPDAGSRRSDRERARLRYSASQGWAPQWFERRSELPHGAKDAMLCRARPKAERAADLIDGPAFIVPQGERGALKRAQPVKRLGHAPLDLGALCKPLRSRPIRYGRGRSFIEALAPRLVMAGVPGAHQIHGTIRRDS